MSIKAAASSNRNIEYVCDQCQKEVGKLNLKVKRVQFKEMGKDGKLIMTRVTSWLCLDCMRSDPDYNRPLRAASPGMRDTRLAVGNDG